MQERINVFTQMLENEPDNTMVLFGLANEYVKAGNHDGAIKTLERYLTFETDEGAGYGMLAKAYESIGDGESAKSTYEKGIQVSLKNGHPSMAQDYKMTLEMDYGE